MGTKALNILNITRDNLGRILVIEVKIDDSVIVLINIDNANTESEQLHTLNDLVNILETIEDIQNKSVVLGGDFNVILNPFLDSEGGKPVIKKRTIAKLIQITENLDLCDIWRIRNPKRRRFTFRQHHSTGFIQRRLDYFFISNSLQESTKTTDTLATFSTDHSPITFSLCHLKEFPRGKGLWKFNKSLIKNENYREQMKTLIKHVLYNLDQDNIVDPQFRWEYLKYEIRKFSTHFSKGIARNKKSERTNLENKLKTLENSPNFVNNPEYIETYEKLDKIYQEKTNGIRIRSKCNWYEHGEKSSKFFLNLEKSRAVQNQIRNVLIDNIEINNQKDINKELYLYYKNLFNKRQHLLEHDINNFLNTVSNFPQLSTEQSLECEKNISEKELLEALKNMPNDKSPGNDGLTKEFLETFWSEIKQTFLSLVIHSFDKGELCTSQRQAIIKLIEKKDKDKRLIQNWRPISLLNVDAKIISKALSKRLKNVLPSLI